MADHTRIFFSSKGVLILKVDLPARLGLDSSKANDSQNPLELASRILHAELAIQETLNASKFGPTEAVFGLVKIKTMKTKPKARGDFNS